MALPLKIMKRFVYVLVVGSLAFCTFYWYSTFSCKHHTTGVFMDRVSDYWRWECNSTLRVCHRLTWNDDSGQTLRTCQMTCGPMPLWPRPNGKVFLSNKSFSFNYANIEMLSLNIENYNVKELLNNAYRIFLEDIKTDQLSSTGGQSDLKSIFRSLMYDFKFHITIRVVKNVHSEFRIGTDESYKLLIQEDNGIIKVHITSATFFGARHALETLRQLIWYDEVDGSLRIISYVKIEDSPIFSYRGLLLDTANRYIPVSAIKRTIDGMAAVKMNVFHWHMTGSTSFPFVTRNLQHAIYGAFSSKEVYTVNDTKEVINYAKVRGVRVLIEIDNPGEIGQGWSWGHRKSVGDLNLCFKNNTESCKNIKYCSQMNMNNNHTYQYLHEIFLQIKNITNHTDVVHLGGTVNFKCWLNSPEITNMKHFKDKGFLGVLKYHQTMVHNSIRDIYKNETPNIILWFDYFKQYNDLTKVIDNKIYIAQVNSDSIYGDENYLVNKGYRVIISHPDKWDLGRLPLWMSVYDHKPWEQISWPQKKYVLGGEALLWTDLIDEQSLDTRLWPNAAAVAEVLWSDSQSTYLEAALRLQLLRERLLERGISAASLVPKWCTQNPGACL